MHNCLLAKQINRKTSPLEKGRSVRNSAREGSGDDASVEIKIRLQRGLAVKADSALERFCPTTKRGSGRGDCEAGGGLDLEKGKGRRLSRILCLKAEGLLVLESGLKDGVELIEGVRDGGGDAVPAPGFELRDG
jgi:hypothetical protein